MEKWCEEIVALGDYTVTQDAKDKIEQIRAKKDKHESADSEG